MRESTARKLVAAGALFDAVTVTQVSPHMPEARVQSLASPAHQLPAVIRYRSKTEEELQRSVPRRIPQMLRQYWGFDPMPFHTRDLEQLFGINHHLVNGRLKADFDDISAVPGRKCKLRPTEHAKSTNFCYVYPILSLAEDPNGAHGIVCVNDDEAMSWLYNIQTFLEGNDEFIRDYPWCAKPGKGSSKKWSQHELWVAGRDVRGNRNPSVMAAGYRSGMLKSRRFKGIFDDLEGLGSVTEGERDKLWRKATQELWRTMESPAMQRRPLQLWDGTPFDIDSFYFKLEDQADIVTDRLPYKYPEDWIEVDLRGKPIWHMQHEKVADFRRNRDPMIFAIAMQLDPTGGNPDIWGSKEIVSYSHSLKAFPMTAAKITVNIDPASGSRVRGADYAGISVTRTAWQEGWELPLQDVHYAEKFKQGLYEQCDRLAYLANWYKAPVLIEGNGHQRYTYEQVMRDRHPEVKLVYFYSTHEKLMDSKLGMTSIKTMMRLNRFHTIEPLGVDTDPGMMALRSEIRDMGVSKHDHICKSVWFAIRHMYEGGRTRSPAGRVNSSGPRPTYFGGGPSGYSTRLNMRRIRDEMGAG